MYRLLATDIDDTLLAPDGTLPEANRRALFELHDRGVSIVFCSGRADVSIRTIASSILPLADDEYLISFNGARVVTADSRRIVAHRYVSPKSVRHIADYARTNGLYLQGYEGDDFLVEEEIDWTERYAKATKTEYRVVPNLGSALTEGSPKLLIIGDHELLESHLEGLAEAGGEAHMVFSKPHYLEIVAEGVDKGTALAELASSLEIPIDETLAVGDAANDVEMLRAAGLGVAVANAREEARSAAKVVLESDSAAGAMEEIARRFFKS